MGGNSSFLPGQGWSINKPPANVDGIPPVPLSNVQFTKFGADASTVSWANTCGVGITLGLTAVTQSLSNERPRWEAYTRKCVITNATAEIRFASASYTADPVDRALSLDIYIEQMPSEVLAATGGANPFITVNISNTTSLGANFSRWTFDAGYLRQGWNTLKLRDADTVSATPGAGNLPIGCAHPADNGTGFNWTSAGQFISVAFNNMLDFTVHIDALRRPAKAKPVLVIGFDASGSGAADEVFPEKVAPLFARYGIRSYCTMTYIYELLFAGSQAWNRLANLHDNFGWDIVNHTWSHGATTIGRGLIPTTVARVSNVVTFTSAAPHGLPANRVIKISVQGASPSNMNGVFDATVTSTTAFTYTAAGVDGSATGTIRAYTFLSEVLNANNAENLRLLEHELGDVARVIEANGFTRGRPVAVLPNNSVPELSLMQTVCDNNGIRFVRAYRGGYAFVSELGIDNPLNFGSFVMDSGAGVFTRTSDIKAKVQGAIDRGDHIWVFGHFILDDEDPANVAFRPTAPDFPPAQGGNPNPPAGVALSGFGGWWYMSQLRDLIENSVGPAVQRGDLLVMSPSEYAAYMNGLEV
jgi:hypothetical protein